MLALKRQSQIGSLLCCVWFGWDLWQGIGQATPLSLQVVAAFAAWMAIFLPSAFCFWRMHNTFGAGKVIAINVSRSVMTLVAIGVAMKFKLQPAGFFVTLACVQTSFLLALKGVAPRQ